MRVIVLGGTRFIGRAIAETLTAAGHAVLVVHRGINEPADLLGVEHLHAERSGWPGCRAAFAAFGADAAVDVSAANGPDARAALAALPPGIALVALSSVDVYRAYGALHGGMQTDAVPLTEESPLRTVRHIDGPEWENLDVEEAYLAAGATILRLGAVYGEQTTSAGSSRCCAVSGPAARGCLSGRAASWGAASTPGTSLRRCWPLWAPAGAPGSA